MPRLTEQQIVEIAERREKGWSYGRLARTYRVTPGAIHYQCLRQGARSPNETGPRPQQEPRIIHLTGGRIQRRFTVSEDQKMQSLALDGNSPSAIARSLDRPLTSVRMRLMALALRQEEA